MNSRKILIPLVVTWTCILQSSVNADLSVFSPITLADQFKDNKVPSKMNNFGYFQEETSRIGKLIIPTEKTDGCVPLTIDDIDAT